MLRHEINSALKQAMKAREERRVATLRLVNAAIKNADIEAETSKKPAPSDDDIRALLQRMIKQRQESAAIYESAGRGELAAGERAEIEIIAGYLPRQLNVLNSRYGSETDLKNAITAFANAGIKSVADVVINHRVGTAGWYDFTNPAWGTYAVAAGDECNCSTGAADTGDSYGAARDIDHTNSVVQADIKNWLNTRLKGVGFSGIRYDYSKGYGASYAKVYHDAQAAAPGAHLPRNPREPRVLQDRRGAVRRRPAHAPGTHQLRGQGLSDPDPARLVHGGAGCPTIRPSSPAHL